MILIIGEIILITIPFVIYLAYNGTLAKLKKGWLIIPEIIAIAALLFVSFKIAADIPYIVRGGKLCEEEIAYVTESAARFTTTAVTVESGKKYWEVGSASDLWINAKDLYDTPNAALYVLPNTRLIYKIDYSFGGVWNNLYSIYSFNFQILIMCLFEVFLIWFSVKYGRW
ncbi:MAG: hypothetical protein LUG52_02020, partial [Clostridia bacterium]|nr:hypothetical protein [Clostridia bacterium]